METTMSHFGQAGLYIGTALILIGILLVSMGWNVVYKRYGRKEAGQGELTSGIYRYIRHPQYTGILLITLGMLLDWAALPMLIMWPIMVVLYYRLAKREESYMLEQFGKQYVEYSQVTGMFLPSLRLSKTLPQTNNRTS